MSAPSRAERFEAIVADYYEDMENGRTTPQLEKLLARSPDLEAELRRFLDDVQAVQARMRPLREAAGPTPLAPAVPEELSRDLGFFSLSS